MKRTTASWSEGYAGGESVPAQTLVDPNSRRNNIASHISIPAYVGQVLTGIPRRHGVRRRSRGLVGHLPAREGPRHVYRATSPTNSFSSSSLRSETAQKFIPPRVQ